MKRSRVIVAVAVSAVAVGGAGQALAAKSKPAPTKTTIRAITKGTSYKINRGATDTLRWNHDVYKIKSGGTLTLTSSANDEGPHTFTFVKSKKDLPRTRKQLNETGQCATKLCQTMVAAHQADPSSQAPPNKLVVDVNKTGVDTGYHSRKAGDSWFLNEPGGKPYHVKVSAKKGTTLYFLCLIHPWMQAKLQVK